MPTYDKDHITPSKYWTQLILPLAYDDSLSYWETLARFNVKLNEVIDWANNYRDELKAYVDNAVYQNLVTMRNELNAYKQEVNSDLQDMQNQLNQIINNVNQIISSFEARINKQIADFTSEINTTIDNFRTEITTDINNFKEEITNQIKENEAWVKAKILAMQAELNAKLQLVYYQLTVNKEFSKMYTDNAITQLIKDLPKYYPVPVICPVNAQLMPLQKCLDLMYETLRVWAISASQYDLLNLTAQRYDDMQIRAIEYDLKAWLYLGPYYYIHFTFSGITGKFVPIQQAIRELYQLLRIESLTAEQYDTKEFSANTYDEKEISAYQYSWSQDWAFVI